MMTQLTCTVCDWSGDETEAIQAGLNWELCPECESVLVSWLRPSRYHRIIQAIKHYRLCFSWWWNSCPPPF